MTTFVVDTSVIVQWFENKDELHVTQAKKLLKDLQSEKINILIPGSLPLELLNALLVGKKCPVEKVNLAIKRLFELSIQIAEVNSSVLQITANLMKEYNIASYDAYFLALAQYENCTLLSDDQKAHGKITNGAVLMLEDY